MTYIRPNYNGLSTDKFPGIYGVCLTHKLTTFHIFFDVEHLGGRVSLPTI